MFCDTPGCKNEGHMVSSKGILCWECNDDAIIKNYHNKFTPEQEIDNFKKELLEKGLEDAKAGRFVKVKDFTSPSPSFDFDQQVSINDTSLTVSERDWEKLQQRLNGPAVPNEKLKAAFEKHKHTMEKLAPTDTSTPKLTLPTDSSERKNYPLFRGCLRYFSAALAGVAKTSFLGNQKHNPGEEMYHARNKSSDHGDCIMRHLMDTEDLKAARERGNINITDQQILDEASSLAWRALAYSQELHEQLGAAPMAPGAKKNEF